MTMSQAEAAMAQAQFTIVRGLAYNGAGELIHPQLLKKYENRATAIVDYAARTQEYSPCSTLTRRRFGSRGGRQEGADPTASCWTNR